MTKCLGIMLIATVLSGCSEGAASPTSPTTTTNSPILFSGTLQPGTTRFYSYTLTTAGTVSAMLASLERNGVPVSNALELGLGIPAGTGCAAQVAANGPSSLEPQLRTETAAGTYCVRITDIDGLPGATAFTIRVVKP